MANITTPASTAQFGKAIDPAVRKHWVDRFEAPLGNLEKILKTMTQEDYNEQHQSYTGLGTMQAVAQGSQFPTGTPIQQFGTTYTPVKFGELVQITDEFRRYDKAAIANATKIAEEQGKQAARSVETRAASLFVNGFNTGYTSYGDSRPLFSTLHTRADGGSNQSNASATGLTLTEANLETGMLALEQVLDDRGQIVSIFADKLLIPPQLRKTAVIIAKSEYRSNTTDNDLNAYNYKEMEGISIDTVAYWKYLSVIAGGSDTAWFLQSTSGHQVSWLWGLKPEIGKFNENVGYTTDTLVWRTKYESSIGWDDWRGVWGSKGDGLAYSS